MTTKWPQNSHKSTQNTPKWPEKRPKSHWNVREKHRDPKLATHTASLAAGPQCNSVVWDGMVKVELQWIPLVMSRCGIAKGRVQMWNASQSKESYSGLCMSTCVCVCVLYGGRPLAEHHSTVCLCTLQRRIAWCGSTACTSFLAGKYIRCTHSHLDFRAWETEAKARRHIFFPEPHFRKYQQKAKTNLKKWKKDHTFLTGLCKRVNALKTRWKAKTNGQEFASWKCKRRKKTR